ncbi:MAG: tol-pal system protein YbgF [Bdellovibrionales bacterium]|nr:tol-pal system protein YbgF [Bdellovibrionales bacterium]
MKSWPWVIVILCGGPLLTACRIGPPPSSVSDQNPPSAISRKLSASDLQERIADQKALIQELESRINQIEGNQESLEHQIETQNKKDQKILQDFDFRLSELEKREYETPQDPSPALQGHSSPESATDQSLLNPDPELNLPDVAPTEGQKKESGEVSEYQSILEEFNQEKNKSRSIQKFKIFVQSHPKSPLAPNAQYWIGEGYYTQGDYARAITAWQGVVDQYPKSNKKCDAMLKQGLAFSKLNDNKNAQLFLEEVLEKCPDTVASEKAKAFLYKIKNS